MAKKKARSAKANPTQIIKRFLRTTQDEIDRQLQAEYVQCVRSALQAWDDFLRDEIKENRKPVRQRSGSPLPATWCRQERKRVAVLLNEVFTSAMAKGGA